MPAPKNKDEFIRFYIALLNTYPEGREGSINYKTIEDSLQRRLKYCIDEGILGESAFSIAAYYLYQYHVEYIHNGKNPPLKVPDNSCSYPERMICTVALILAEKFNNDKLMDNNTIAAFMNVALPALNQVEMDFLKKVLDFNVHVTPEHLDMLPEVRANPAASSHPRPK